MKKLDMVSQKELKIQLEGAVRKVLEETLGPVYLKIQSSTVIQESLVPMGEKFGFHIVLSAHPKEEKKTETP